MRRLRPSPAMVVAMVAYSDTLSLQTTRTTSQASDMVLTCQADQIPWRAGATSLVAVPVASLALQGG